MKKVTKNLSVLLLCLCGCTGLPPRLGPDYPEDDLALQGKNTESSKGSDSKISQPISLEDEEEIHEDSDDLDNLISGLTAAGVAVSNIEPVERTAKTENVGTKSPETAIALSAYRNWKQTDAECLAELNHRGIRAHAPNFDTPFVKTPLIVDGEIEGVSIRSKWPRESRENEVMDCRLVLALDELAKEAKKMGTREMLFYSTYRPLKPPAEKCEKGKKGRGCRAALETYRKALKTGKMSQHRRALAIDIRWFTMSDGETIDVLQHFEGTRGTPPCEIKPETKEGLFLKELACSLYEKRIFNVMLTPNANKEHENHFHFDITPEADWYIIR